MLVCHASTMRPFGATPPAAPAARTNGTAAPVAANAALCRTRRRVTLHVAIAAPPVPRAPLFTEPCVNCRSAMHKSLRRCLADLVEADLSRGDCLVPPFAGRRGDAGYDFSFMS